MSIFNSHFRPHLRTAIAVCLAFTALAPGAFADPLRADLSNYSPAWLTAAVDQEILTVTWTGADNATLRARYVIEDVQPLVRELAVRPLGGP